MAKKVSFVTIDSHMNPVKSAAYVFLSPVPFAPVIVFCLVFFHSTEWIKSGSDLQRTKQSDIPEVSFLLWAAPIHLRYPYSPVNSP